MAMAIASVDEIQKQGIRIIRYQDKDIVIVFLKGHIHAFDRWCPHARGDLSKGRLDGSSLTCLNHGLVFDLNSGTIRTQDLDEDLLDNLDPNLLKTLRLTTYRTSIIDGIVFIHG